MVPHASTVHSWSAARPGWARLTLRRGEGRCLLGPGSYLSVPASPVGSPRPPPGGERGSLLTGSRWFLTRLLLGVPRWLPRSACQVRSGWARLTTPPSGAARVAAYWGRTWLIPIVHVHSSRLGSSHPPTPPLAGVGGQGSLLTTGIPHVPHTPAFRPYIHLLDRSFIGCLGFRGRYSTVRPWGCYSPI